MLSNITRSLLMAAARLGGGFTYDPRLECLRGKNLFGGVSAFGWGVSTPGEGRIDMAQEDEVIGAAIDEYASSRAKDLAKRTHFLGGWMEDGKLVLDVSVIVKDHEAAILLAQAWGQRAVYNYHEEMVEAVEEVK